MKSSRDTNGPIKENYFTSWVFCWGSMKNVKLYLYNIISKLGYFSKCLDYFTRALNKLFNIFDFIIILTEAKIIDEQCWFPLCTEIIDNM